MFRLSTIIKFGHQHSHRMLFLAMMALIEYHHIQIAQLQIAVPYNIQNNLTRCNDHLANDPTIPETRGMDCFIIWTLMCMTNMCIYLVFVELLEPSLLVPIVNVHIAGVMGNLESGVFGHGSSLLFGQCNGVCQKYTAFATLLNRSVLSHTGAWKLFFCY